MDAKERQTNRLLACLPDAEHERLHPHLELVTLPLGSVLYESGDRLRHVYFPTDAVVSLLYVLSDGDSAEIAVVGNDGVIGVAQFMGGTTTNSRAVVQSGGGALRLAVDALQAEFAHAGALQHLLLRYMQALMTQMMQTGACNKHHPVEQQLSRWLLMSLDRMPGRELQMTEGLIANMLGVRRSGASDAAGALQAAGLIRYDRGRITILDRPGLERQVCECYRVVRDEYARLLPDVISR